MSRISSSLLVDAEVILLQTTPWLGLSHLVGFHGIVWLVVIQDLDTLRVCVCGARMFVPQTF